MNSLHVCPCCGKEMNTHVCLRTQMAECVNEACKLFMVTLEVGRHEQLTPAEIDQWQAMNARLAAQTRGE